MQVKIGSPAVNNHNPSACATTLSNAVYVIDPSTMSAKLINSTLLMAVAAHKRVKLYMTMGCLYGQARIVAVEAEP